MYVQAIPAFYLGQLSWTVTSSLTVILADSSYVPDSEAHQYLSSVGAAELAVPGYSRQPLLNLSHRIDTANNLVIFDGDDVSFTNLEAPAFSTAILISDTGNPATSRLITWTSAELDTNAQVSSFAVRWNDGGIIQVPYTV